MASVFSGKAGRNAAIWAAGQAQTQRGEAKEIFGQGREQADALLTGGYDTSLEALDKQYGVARGDLSGALTDATGTITAGRDASLGALNQGYGQAIQAAGQYYGQGAEALEKGIAGYDPYVQAGTRALGTYEGSLGLGGPEARAAAEAAFKEGPGYQWGVDQATSQAARAANKSGMGYSGNTADAMGRLAINLANKEYGGWQDRLKGMTDQGLSATQGQAGQYANLATLRSNQATTTADLYKGQGKDTASVYTDAAGKIGGYQMDTGKGMAGLAYGHGENQANLSTNLSQGLASNALGYAQNLAGADSAYYGTVIPAGQSGMMAGQQAAANRTGALMGGLQMGAQLLGGGGGMFGKLWG